MYDMHSAMHFKMQYFFSKFAKYNRQLITVLPQSQQCLLDTKPLFESMLAVC